MLNKGTEGHSRFITVSSVGKSLDEFRLFHIRRSQTLEETATTIASNIAKDVGIDVT